MRFRLSKTMLFIVSHNHVAGKVIIDPSACGLFFPFRAQTHKLEAPWGKLGLAGRGEVVPQAAVGARLVRNCACTKWTPRRDSQA